MPDVMPQEYVTRAEDYVGNSVVVRIARDRAIYAHIERGSVAVKVRNRVRIGDVLDKLGNSGNSGAPHLHFVTADSPDAVTATSIPFVIERWTLQGNAVLPPSPGPIPVIGPSLPGPALRVGTGLLVPRQDAQQAALRDADGAGERVEVVTVEQCLDTAADGRGGLFLQAEH